jgi:hypothetical protein
MVATSSIILKKLTIFFRYDNAFSNPVESYSGGEMHYHTGKILLIFSK